MKPARGAHFSADDAGIRRHTGMHHGNRIKMRGHREGYRKGEGSAVWNHTPSLPDARPRSDRFRCGGRGSKFLQPRLPLIRNLDSHTTRQFHTQPAPLRLHRRLHPPQRRRPARRRACPALPSPLLHPRGQRRIPHPDERRKLHRRHPAAFQFIEHLLAPRTRCPYAPGSVHFQNSIGLCHSLRSVTPTQFTTTHPQRPYG